jgi:hypothetical protein
MDPDTLRGGTGDLYWRRRMVVLIAVLVVVAIVAWACSSGPDGPEQISSAQSSPSPTPQRDGLLAGLPVLTLTPTPSTALAPTPRPTRPRPTPSASPTAAPRRPGQPCVERDLVLHMRGRQEIYPTGARPNFVLTLVNTGPVMCTADVGPRTMEIRITSGRDRVWSTADCVSGPGVEVQRLERGVPYVRTLDWDRRRSAADCAAKRAEALPGTYVALVRSGHLRSRKTVFHLR